jgi:hypothetical protein
VVGTATLRSRCNVRSTWPADFLLSCAAVVKSTCSTSCDIVHGNHKKLEVQCRQVTSTHAGRCSILSPRLSPPLFCLGGNTANCTDTAVTSRQGNPFKVTTAAVPHEERNKWNSPAAGPAKLWTHTQWCPSRFNHVLWGTVAFGSNRKGCLL